MRAVFSYDAAVILSQSESFIEANPWVPSTAIGGTIAVLGLILGFIYFKKNQSRKTLDFRVISNILIVSGGELMEEGAVEVTVGGKKVIRPRIVTVRYINTGNKEILDDDFLDQIRLNEKIRVLHIKVGQKGAIKPIVSASMLPDVQPTVSADCLNSGDELEVQYVVEDFDNLIVPFYRIKGATRKARNLESYNNRRAAYLTVSVGLVTWIASFSIITIAGGGFHIAALIETALVGIMFGLVTLLLTTEADILR